MNDFLLIRRDLILHHFASKTSNKNYLPNHGILLDGSFLAVTNK